jgi:long-chain acyl-CoA synthetase
MNLAAWLVKTAKLHPGRPALIRGVRVCADYAEFARRAAAIAGYLRDRCGVGKGDHVALFLPNCTEYLEILYGIRFWGQLRCR